MAETYQILIVDDEPDILSTYKNFFEKRGYLVETANNGKEGLEKIRNNLFSVIITDLRMPEMDGFEMIRQANQYNKHLTWIILTGHGEREDMLKALKLGVSDWFDKQGIDISELLAKVKELTNSKEKYYILMVDSEVDSLQNYQNFFKTRGYILETAKSGEEGLEKIRNGEFDIAIIDIDMPKMTGFEMIRQANAEDIDPEWIILTKDKQADNILKALKLGVADWFNKTEEEMPQLFEKVRKLTYGHLDDVRRIFTRIREDMRTEQHNNE